MTLLEKQQVFTRQLSVFLDDLNALGYEVTLGEAWRPDATAEYYQKIGKGTRNSLHRIRLAIDLNLFKDGKFLKQTPEYELAGKLWESYSHPGCVFTWGGHFEDGNHFSITHNGVR